MTTWDMKEFPPILQNDVQCLRCAKIVFGVQVPFVKTTGPINLTEFACGNCLRYIAEYVHLGEIHEFKPKWFMYNSENARCEHCCKDISPVIELLFDGDPDWTGCCFVCTDCVGKLCSHIDFMAPVTPKPAKIK